MNSKTTTSSTSSEFDEAQPVTVLEGHIPVTEFDDDVAGEDSSDKSSTNKPEPKESHGAKDE